jgi:hypothetical protein
MRKVIFEIAELFAFFLHHSFDFNATLISLTKRNAIDVKKYRKCHNNSLNLFFFFFLVKNLSLKVVIYGPFITYSFYFLSQGSDHYYCFDGSNNLLCGSFSPVCCDRVAFFSL